MATSPTFAGFLFTFAGVVLTVVVGPIVQRAASRNRAAERDASAASAVSTLAEAMDALQGENRRLRDVQQTVQGRLDTNENRVEKLQNAFERHLLHCTTPDDLRAALDAQG